jgi:splicing factor 3B subunit 3
VSCKLDLRLASFTLSIVPGGQSATTNAFDGPSGVLVCCEDHIIYKHQGVPQHRVPIPKRQHPLHSPDRPVIITSAVMHKMKVFILVLPHDKDLIIVLSREPFSSLFKQN